MFVISPLKTTKDSFDTFPNLYDKKALSQKSALKNKIRNLNEKEENDLFLHQDLLGKILA